MSKLDEINANQRQYSDKHVYENIDGVLNKILNEKINLGQRINPFCRHWRHRYEWFSPIMKNMGFKIQEVIKIKIKYNCLLKIRDKSLHRSLKKNIKNSTILVKSSTIKNNNNEIKYAK